MHLFGRDSEIFKYNFSLICESSNMLRLVRGPGCIDHFHLGSSRTNFSKSNISPAPSPGAPPALSEDVWTVHSSSSLRCCLLSSHPNPVWIFRRGNSIFQLTWTSEHFSGGSGLCRTWNIYIIAVKERENQSINITRTIKHKFLAFHLRKIGINQ